jgi:hypothetical protein
MTFMYRNSFYMSVCRCCELNFYNILSISMFFEVKNKSKTHLLYLLVVATFSMIIVRRSLNLS